MYLAESNFKDNVKVVCNASFSYYLLNHPAIVGIAVLILCYACLVILLLFALHHSVFLCWDCKGGLKTNSNLWVLQALIINWLSLSIYYPWWCWIKISVYFVKFSYQNINDHWKLPSDSFYYSSSLPYACSCILAAALKLFSVPFICTLNLMDMTIKVDNQHQQVKWMMWSLWHSYSLNFWHVD